MAISCSVIYMIPHPSYSRVSIPSFHVMDPMIYDVGIDRGGGITL